MQATRQRILDYLKKNQRATAPELSQYLDLTQANIRHHLEVLAGDGKIEIVGELPPSGRGRPTLVYMASRAEQENSLELLSSTLLRQSLKNLNPRKKDAFLAELAGSLAGSTTPQGSITLRLGSATQILNELDYKAHWEAHADAPHIFLGHCPYGPIITQHPELCQMDQALIEHLTGARVEQIEKQSRSPDSPVYCRFIITSGI